RVRGRSRGNHPRPGRASRAMTLRARMGIAGRIAGAFLDSRLTPLTIVTSVLLGLLALATLPREEEPQIQVPMVDIQLAWPGSPVEQAERQGQTTRENTH